MPVEVKPLGPFEVGQQPTITAHFTDKTGGTGVVTGTHWVVTDPNDEVVQDVTSPNLAIVEEADNLWSLLMPVLIEDWEGKVLWVECTATGGLVAAHRRRVGVARQDD